MFDLSAHIEFDKQNRAYCPSCTAKKGRQPSQRSLSLVPGGNGAYRCHAGCTPEEIRGALGDPAKTTTRKATPPPAAPAKLYTSAEVNDRHDRLRLGKSPVAEDCLNWLKARGMPWDVVEHFRLGLLQSPGLKGIQIPIPVGDEGFHLKTRCYPFDQEPKWSQKGIPASIFWGHRAPDHKRLFIVEGEWDAMWLGWLASNTVGLRDKISVCTFTCGANTVPPPLLLQDLPQNGDVYIFYDRDEPGEKGALKLRTALGDRAYVARVPGGDGSEKGWDISDYLKAGGSLEHLNDACPKARANTPPPQEEPPPQVADLPPEEEFDTPLERSKGGRTIDLLRRILEGKIRFNTLKGQIELSGHPLRIEEFYLDLLDKYNLQAGKDLVCDAVVWLGRKNSYSPVVEYLESCASPAGADPAEYLATVASRYLGAAEPLHQTYLTKTLIAAVARAYNPGCKHDTALILQGAQGIGKSTFFKVLGGPYFDDSFGSANDKDERLKLHSSWICEWAELESVFRRRDLSELKSFLSCSTDILRVPYGRTHEWFPRPSILVGTTNQDEFLSDPTGSRRFWVIPCQGRIDREALATERDAIWGAAVALYKAGAIWHLSEAEAEDTNIFNSRYQIEDPWLKPISQYVTDLKEIQITDLLTQALGKEIGQITRSDQMRAADILKGLGWAKTKRHGKSFWEVKETGIPGVPGIPSPVTASVTDGDTFLGRYPGIPQEDNPPAVDTGYLWGIPPGEVSSPETLAAQGRGIPGIPGTLNSLEAVRNGSPLPKPGTWIRFKRTGSKPIKAQVISPPADWMGSSEPGVFVRDTDGAALLVPLARILEGSSNGR